MEFPKTKDIILEKVFSVTWNDKKAILIVESGNGIFAELYCF